MIENISNRADPELPNLPPEVPVDIPTYTPTTAANYNPEADLMISRTIRGKMITALVGTKLPTDGKEVATLLSVLKDQDATALGVIRAKIEKDASDLSGENAAIVRAVVAGMRSAKPTELIEQAPPGVEAPSLPDDIGEVKPFVPGEMDVGATETTLEDFKKRVSGDITFAETDVEEE